MRMRSSCDRRERTSFMCSNQTDTLDLVPTQLTGTKLDLLETRNSKHTNNRGSCLTATIATSNCSKSPSNSARASQSWALLICRFSSHKRWAAQLTQSSVVAALANEPPPPPPMVANHESNPHGHSATSASRTSMEQRSKRLSCRG